jgi:lactate racemase
MSNVIRLPQLCWNGVRDLELPLPDEWQVEICNMKGYNRRALTPEEIRKAVQNPLGCPPIHVSVKNKKQIAIIFDDIQRATRVAQIIPAVLEELAEAGIQDSQVRFIAATGCHAALDRYDFVKKLGEEVLHRFPVYSHNAFGNCVDIGMTQYGTRILANAEVMSCDFKIAIGSIVPHVFAGFGGGAKIILPGICHRQTCLDFHQAGSRYAQKNKDKPVGIGVLEDNPLRLDMEEAAAMVGLDIKIDTLMNSYAETVAVYAGDLKTAYPEAVKDARRHYDTDIARDKDVVIANAFAKVAECESGLEMAYPSVKKEGGDVILIGNAPEGHVEHYLAEAWGKTTRSSFQMLCRLGSNIKRLIIYTEYPDLTIYGLFAQPEKVKVVCQWDEVLSLLRQSHPGQASVAVYPNSDIQYCSSASGSKSLSFISTD